jgi:hypothetical protein
MYAALASAIMDETERLFAAKKREQPEGAPLPAGC